MISHEQELQPVVCEQTDRFKENYSTDNIYLHLFKSQLNNCIDWILWLYINKNNLLSHPSQSRGAVYVCPTMMHLPCRSRTLLLFPLVATMSPHPAAPWWLVFASVPIRWWRYCRCCHYCHRSQPSRTEQAKILPKKFFSLAGLGSRTIGQVLKYFKYS